MRFVLKARFVLVFTALLVALLGLSIQANASDFHSPRTAGLGGAGHAGPMLNDAIYLNPSYAAFLPSYSISGNYSAFNSPTQANGGEDYHGHLLNASIQDGRNDLFQAGVAGTLREQGKLVNIGAAKAAIKNLGFGIGAKMFFPNSGNGANVNDTIVSTTWAITPYIQAAAVVDNLVQTAAGAAQGFYREYILGTKFNIDSILLIYVDPHFTPNAPGHSLYGYESGIELTPFTDIFIRFGMFRNSSVPEMGNVRGRGYGAGLGWIGPRLSFDYGLYRVLDPDTVVSHVFGVTLYF